LEAKAKPDTLFDVEAMEAAFKQQYDGCMFTIGQPLIFAFEKKNLLATVKKLELVELMSFEKSSKVPAREGQLVVALHDKSCSGSIYCKRSHGSIGWSSDRDPICKTGWQSASTESKC